MLAFWIASLIVRSIKHMSSPESEVRAVAATDSTAAGTRTIPVIALLFFWIVLGLIGHDPWKPDEAYTFGLVNHIVKTGHMLVPELAGEPFMEKPPLYFVTAAATARLFAPWLPLYDGARLASGLYLAIALAAVAFSAQRLFGRPHGLLAALMLAGATGLLIDGHALITDTALLAGTALAFAGLAVALEKTRLAGFLLGTGVGIGFLSKGLIGPGMFGLTAVLLPVVGESWRSRRYLAVLAWALAWALPWLLIWPILLYRSAPALFYEWFWINNFGRFLGFVSLGPQNSRWFYLETLPWYALPAWPFALATVARREWRARPGVQLALTTLLVMFGILTLAHDSRAIYAMPMLVPLVVLASPALRRTPAHWLRVFARFSVLLFGTLAASLWLGWLAYKWRAPAFLYIPIHQHLAGVPRAVPGEAILIALVLTGVALWQFQRCWRATRAAPALKAWVTGLVLVWGLLTTIWLPWLNGVKTYRGLMVAMRPVLPIDSCLASSGLGEPQRALLDYYDGLRTRRIEMTGSIRCPSLLMQANRPIATDALGPDWTRIWTGARPDDHREHYALFRRRLSGNPILRSQ